MDDDGSEALAGRGVLVVGASTGIGRAVAVAARGAGAEVAAAARRYDLLRQLAQETGPGVHPVQCDVRIPMSCESMAKAATAAVGALDTVIYATGVNHLAPLVDTDADAWHTLVETNLVGAALVTRAVLPLMAAGERRPRFAFLSSHSVARPWPGLGAYAASKAGLDTLVDAWRTEVPDVGFTRVVVGPTLTGMADDWDPEVAETAFATWHEQGFFEGIEPVEADVVASALVGWMAEPEPPDDLSMV